MNNETIQPLEGFAAYFGIDPDYVVREMGTFKRDSEGNYELIRAEFVVLSHSKKRTVLVFAETIARHAPDHLARVEALITERDPLRCTECRKLACICDGA
jgi:alkyl hydroperoxide reductase subunit AhpC